MDYWVKMLSNEHAVRVKGENTNYLGCLAESTTSYRCAVDNRAIEQMEITINLGVSGVSNSTIRLNIPDENPTINDIIQAVRQELSPWHVAVMERGIEGLDGPDGVESVVGGIESMPLKASLFLALGTDEGLTKLEGTKRAIDYNINKDATLFILCSAESLNG